MKNLWSTILLGLAVSAAAAEPGTLFHASFDGNKLSADSSVGKPDPVQNENTKIVKLPGGISGAGRFENQKEILAYESAGNIDFQNGAFACRLIPDWNTSDPKYSKSFSVIFQAGSGWCHNDPDILSLIYDAGHRRLCFLVTGKKTAGKLQLEQCATRDGSVVFEKGKPCTIAATWKNLNTPGAKAELEIYWNGKQIAKRTFNSFAFKPNARFTLGNYAGRNYNHHLRAVFDYVKLFKGNPFFRNASVTGGKPAACFVSSKNFTGTASEKVCFISRESHRIDGKLDDWNTSAFFSLKKKSCL